MNDKWKGVLKKVVPTLGAALGGPLAGVALSALGELLLSDPEATESDVIKAFSSTTPETLLKLRELDQNFAAKMKSLDIDVFKLEVEDRSSAREMYAVNYWPQIVISALFIVGYFSILTLFTIGKVSVPSDLQSPFNIILGVLTASITAIMAFWFGSSYGSKEKTLALAQSAPPSSNGK